MNTNYTYVNNTDLIKELKRKIPKQRFIHSIAVAYTATSLAMVYDVDIHAAYLAGLLHDYAKDLPNIKQVAFCKKHNIPLTAYEENNPAIVHGKVGAFMVMKKFNITDEDIINAIMHHTLGRINMSKLEKIVFIADYIEPERKIIPNIEHIRKMAFKNLDAAMYLILENIINYLSENGVTVDADALDIVDFYKREAQIEQN